MVGSVVAPSCPECREPMALRRPVRKGARPEYYCPFCDEERFWLRIRRRDEERNARILADLDGAYNPYDVREPLCLP